MKWKGYEIVRATCRAPMERAVKEWMDKGWVPLGGVQVVIEPRVDQNLRETFYQAMGLPEDEKPT